MRTLTTSSDVGGVSDSSDIDLTTEFVQILHDGHAHWLLVSTVGAKRNKVIVYDSMYLSIGSHTRNQIACSCGLQRMFCK